MELVSVIIPTHNRANLLKKAIDSVLSQTYQNIEVVVVDDASTDNTDSMINEFYSDEVTYVKVKKSKGGNYARNLGAKKAKGNVIAFLDDDDTWDPSKIKKQMGVFYSDSAIGLVYTGSRIIYTSTNNSYINMPTEEGNLSEKILIKNYIGTTSTVAIKKEIFNQAGGFDNEMPALQDYDLWIRISQIAKIGCVKEPLIDYYNHDSGEQISDNLQKILTASEKIEKKYEKIISNLDKKTQTKRLIQKYNYLGKRKLRVGDKTVAREYFLKSMKIKPNIRSIVLYSASLMNYNTLVRLTGILRNK